MAENLQNQLKEVGSKLEKPPASKDDLIKLLTQATECLSELDQSPPKALLDSMQPLLNNIVKPENLKHEDKEVSLLVAICTCEITRITAPEAPYDDDVLKDIFHLFVSTFKGLKDTKDPSFEKRVTVLDTVAKYRSFVVMLDLECDDLVNEMFRTFFTVASEELSKTVISSMETIMAVLLEESEEIGDDLLLIILSVLGRDKKKDITSTARRLAMDVIKQSVEVLETCIKKFILSSMSGDKSSSNPNIDYHEVIFDIYRCAPQILSKIVPNLRRELVTDKVDLRLKAVKLVGDLFSIKESTIHPSFNPIFLEFLKKLNDKVVEIRMSVVEYAKLCLLSDPKRTEAPQLVAALTDRLLDDDESVRKQVIAVISDVASLELSSIPPDTIKLVADHLEDKSVLVKKYTLEKLSDIYKAWCLKKSGDLNVNQDYDWIPGRILKSYFDKDFGQDTVENLLSTSLFPIEISVKDKVKNWVKLFSKFDKVEVNALEKILEERQRLQLELKKYLSLRETYKDSDASEIQKKTAVCVRFMSHCFVDPVKAEADFQILDQLKDDKIWKILTTLVDPKSGSVQSKNLRDELFKIVDEKHPLYELLNTLSIKCSYTIFDKDFVKHLLLETNQQKSDGNKLLTQSCIDILVILASFTPLLLSGIEEDLVHLLEEYDDETIKEGVLSVLTKAGEYLGESSSSLDLTLERICIEGSRKQAKSAVNALSAITKDDGLKSLSVLYKRLVDELEKKTNLPSVLQSLECIAQTAMPVFETQEGKIKEFIKKEILSCSQKPGNRKKITWDNKSELCSLKIFAIKTLVKSYMPVKDAHLRVGIDGLLKDLQNILSFGEISKEVESSSVDKAHLKLASAKAIIRLSKHWDKEIPVDLFHLTLRTSETGFPQVRKLFLKKVHQYIKNKSLDPKYVCAFLLYFGSKKPILEEENQNLSDILKTCDEEGKSSVVYILPYLIHALAHYPSCPNIDECKDVKAYEIIYRKLYIYISKLAKGDENVGLKREDVNLITSVLRNIKCSKDAVDTNMSKNLYAICELCMSVTKRLGEKEEHEEVDELVIAVSLPQVLYTPNSKKEVEKEDENKEDEVMEDVNKEDEKIEEDNKDEKKEEDNKDEKKEEEKIEEVNKEEVKKDENKEKEKKDEKIEEEVNKEDEKMEEVNKEDEKKDDEKIAEINKEDEKKEESNKEDEKMEEINKEDEKKDETMEEVNKEDEKKEDKKIEEVNKEDENKEAKKNEVVNIEEKKKEDEKKEEVVNKEDDKKEEEISKKEDEKKEEVVNTEVTEGRTWLADNNALSYFDSLILDANGNVTSRIQEEEDIMKDIETDGNEIPLGKIIKQLKAKGSKARKELKNGPTPTPETENNVDIMGMLKEINSDNNTSTPTKIESVNNGHSEIKNESNLKRKETPNDLANVSVPKRRRSTSSAKSHKRKSFVTSGPTFNNKKDDDDDYQESESDDKSSLDDRSAYRRVVRRKERRRSTGEVAYHKPKNPLDFSSNQRARSLRSGPLRKRKRRRVSRLVRCTSNEKENKTTDLIGKRIKVWWPMDKAFYEGEVKSYNQETKKHEVLYDDGDIEVLSLDKEKWKPVKMHKLAERKLMAYSPPHKSESSMKSKSSDSSKKTKESTDISPSSMVRGKRTPRENLKQGQKGVSQRSDYLEIRSKDPEVSSKTDTMDISEGEEGSDKIQKSRSKETETKDAESSSNGSMSSPGTGIANSAPSEKSESESESESTEVQKPDGKESSSSSDDDNADMAEYTDDEPLGVWKSRIGKSGEGK